jgi:transcriptional regulator with XRE-family HTH domain
MITTMGNLKISPEDVRRVRRLLRETQAEFARRLDVDPVTVARWETGQRSCAGLYAVAIWRLDPEGPGGPPADSSPTIGRPREDPKLSALAQLVRAFFGGSTARAVSALLERENLTERDLDALAGLIERKRRKKVKR